MKNPANRRDRDPLRLPVANGEPFQTVEIERKWKCFVEVVSNTQERVLHEFSFSASGVR
jgi:hypothetical protein